MKRIALLSMLALTFAQPTSAALLLCKARTRWCCF